MKELGGTETPKKKARGARIKASAQKSGVGSGSIANSKVRTVATGGAGAMEASEAAVLQAQHSFINGADTKRIEFAVNNDSDQVNINH